MGVILGVKIFIFSYAIAKESHQEITTPFCINHVHDHCVKSVLFTTGAVLSNKHVEQL